MAKVLIVEDDIQLSTMYKTKLQHDDYNVVVANEGRTGLQMAVKEKPDIILLDIMLIDRNYSGLSMLEDLRKTPEGKDVPVIALTNLTKREVADKAKALGVKDYLIKAMHTPEDVVKKIRECLEPTSEPDSSPQPQE
jgi:DNA-binding response OmpR family regulator